MAHSLETPDMSSFPARAAGFLLLGFSLFIEPPLPAPAEPEGPLEQVANAWLARVDRGELEAAWAEAGAALREGEDGERWAERTRELRSRFGRVAGRELLARDYQMQLEGGPPGVFFTLRYRTRFADWRPPVLELVTLSPDVDGRYRVVAYGVRRAESGSEGPLE